MSTKNSPFVITILKCHIFSTAKGWVRNDIQTVSGSIDQGDETCWKKDWGVFIEDSKVFALYEGKVIKKTTLSRDEHTTIEKEAKIK